jgi:3-oxoacyl-[acyl-carrier-protein] synthase III
MASIVAAEFIAPPRVPFIEVQAAEVNDGYIFLSNIGAVGCVPYRTGLEVLDHNRYRPAGGARWFRSVERPALYAVPEDRRRRHLPEDGMEICVAPRGRSSADLAVDAAKALARSITPAQQSEIGAVIFCHNSMDELINESVVGRICSELGLADRLAFSINQLHNCAVFAALQMAHALVAGDDALPAVLVVGADKWLYPFIRSFGPIACFGDGAAALLVGAVGGAGYEILHVELACGPDEPSVLDGTAPLDGEAIARRVAAVIEAALHNAGLIATDVDLVVPQNYGERLIRRVSEIAGLGRVALYLDGLHDRGHLSSADTMANVAGVLGDPRYRDSRTLLLWGAGLSGQAACCLLRRNAADAAQTV